MFITLRPDGLAGLPYEAPA